MDSNNVEVTALVEKIEAIIADPQTVTGLQDDAIRRRFREAGRKLSLAMEVSGDTTFRIMNAALQLILTQVGVEKGIFDILSEANGSTLTNEAISTRTKIDPILMKRLLRYYQSLDMIKQPGGDAYTANNVTKGLAGPRAHSGISCFFEVILPAFMGLPPFLRETGYKNPTDSNYCPWHVGHKTEMPPFQWLQAHPEHQGYFQAWMTARKQGLPIFLDAMDFQKEFAQGTDALTPVFVDVGGAMGHQCVAMKQRYPNLVGRIILQDKSFVIEQVKANPLPGFEGIEAEAYDFFTPQPIRGARAYYFRNVLHDWPDDKCIEILHNVKPSMTADSVVLIDDVVLPECGTPWRAAQLDISVLACLAATERSRAEWQALLGEAGFEILKIVKYTDECEDCIIVAAPK